MIPQHITYGAGGTIYFYSLVRLTSPTVTIKTNKNSAIVTAASATQSSANSTLSSAASAGDSTISVASGTGFAYGQEIHVSSTKNSEAAVVKSVSGTTITLLRPLLMNHASGNNVRNNTISYTVSSSDADTLFWDGLAIWYNNGVYYAQTPVECTRYPLFRLSTLNDVWDEYPQLRDLLSPSDDPNRLLLTAHNDVMTTISAVDRARVFYASGKEIARAVVFQFLVNYFRHEAQESSTVLFERYQLALADEIKKIVSILPRDSDQDQYSQASEKMHANSIRILRS